MVRQIQQLMTDQAKLQLQVSSGRRITQPEDDPAAVGGVLNLQSEQRQLAQYANKHRGRCPHFPDVFFRAARPEESFGSCGRTWRRWAPGALSTDSMRTYGNEVDQLLEQALQLANSRSGGDYIYGGTAVDAPPFVATRDVNGKDHVDHLHGKYRPGVDSTLRSHECFAVHQLERRTPALVIFSSNLITLRDASRAPTSMRFAPRRPALLERRKCDHRRDGG